MQKTLYDQRDKPVTVQRREPEHRHDSGGRQAPEQRAPQDRYSQGYRQERPNAHFYDVSELAEVEEPNVGIKIGMVISGLIAVVDAAAMIAKIDLGKKIPFVWWFLWLVFVVAAGVFFFLLNKRKPEPEPQPMPETVDLSHMKFEKEEAPPPLDLPIERTQKKMSTTANDVWNIVSEFMPTSPSKDFTYQDQLYGKLKKTLLQKYMVTPEYKRVSRTKPDILVDREIAVEAKDVTPELIEKMYKRLSGMRVEYKQIIVVLFDKGRVPHSQIDRVMNECMTDIKEVVAYRGIKP